ncbi:MAG TPA: glycosyltransferase family 4 protein [Candidatus Paceibacterota bacterium]|nr:glycosyltransferase family 4 protein [Candidatus Paceibacterota bacterium]
MPEQKKKILIFSLAYYPHVGGAEVAIKEITDRLPNIEFHMVTMRWSQDEPMEEIVGRVHVYRVGSGASYLSKVLFIPRAVLRARTLSVQHFDGMWAMMSYMTFPIALLRILFGVHVPYILTLQEGDPFEHVFERWYIKFFAPLLSYGFMRARSITAISNFLGTWAKHAGYQGPVHIIPNGVDLAHFSVSRVEHEGIVLVTASRLVHKNAVDDVIRALALLPETVRFKVAGTGPDEVMLKELAQTAGVASRVEFVGHIDHRELPQFLERADIFIRPSRSEGMGNAFIEAMAAGLPIIGTHVGGIPDFLKDGETGYVAEVDNPKNIAAAVTRALLHADERAAIAARAKALAAQYDWDIVARRMNEEAFAALS